MAKEKKEKQAAKCLYEVLNVDRTAGQQDIKKVYRQLCLKLHPDKNPGDEEAKARFQELQKVYAVLGDPEKRAVYDQTGIADEDLLGSDFDAMAAFFRANPLTTDDIDGFYDSYRGSTEEQQDLFELYKEHKGDMEVVFEWQLCSDEKEDSHRFMHMIQAAIDEGALKQYKPFIKWAKQVKRQPEPTLDPLRKRSKPKTETSHALAQIRQKKQPALPDDAEFEALQAKLFGNKAGSSSGAEVQEPAAAKRKGKTAAAAAAAAPAGKSKGKKRAVVDLEVESGDEREDSQENSEPQSESESEEEAPAPKKSSKKGKAAGKGAGKASAPAGAKKQKVKAGK